MTVYLFTPIVQSNLKENLSSLQFTTRFFNFGQTCYRVTSLSSDQFLYLEQADHQKPTWLGVALRIVAILTIIIPLFMIIGAMIYRAANKFVVKQLDLNNHFSTLSPDVQKLICANAFLDSKALRLVNKQINSFFNETDVDLMRNRLILDAFEQSLKVLEMMNDTQISECSSKGAHFFIQNGYKKQALDLLIEKYEKLATSQRARSIIEVMTLCDLDRALEIAHSQKSRSFHDLSKDFLLLYISCALVPINLNKALEIYKSRETNFPDHRFLRLVAIETAKSDLEQGLNIADTLEDINKHAALIEIMENIELSHPEKAKEICNRYLFYWFRLDNRELTVRVIHYFARNDRMNEAMELADQIQEPAGYGVIAKEFVKVNPEEALAWVKTLDIKYRFRAMAEIVKATRETDKAKELIEDMFISDEFESTHAILTAMVCAELMTDFDSKRAIVMADSLSGSRPFDHAEALIGIIKKIINLDKPCALDLAKTVINIAESLPCAPDIDESFFTYSIANSQKFETFLSLAEALSKGR